MGKIRLIIMTKSSKFGGYCVAGINTETGEWVRLVSDDENAVGRSLTLQDMEYKEGKYCNILDEVEVITKGNESCNLQPENIIIDTSKYWKKIQSLTINDVLEEYDTDQVQYIFGNRYAYVSEEVIDEVGYSLVWIAVENLEIHTEVNDSGKHKAKASFTYNGIDYEHISVTDPQIYGNEEIQNYEEAILILSLPAGPYNGKYYKFIAKVFI
ncbi:hypothetical protein CS063_17145 [Sporanaerobium hydrogeniformans]|uniref:Uncharacterized protein n=1 Tax=Sporanaerobium hydrogeniformans TaxID=3072179 RepID=A0AC61D924_9FIRM|nr:hypothetical protein [Sporanaerobium hydrogeniformans]PHV69201.1 hypothetical protein CS063_17145 [Sporanaerobium hydrogeniformans]